MKHWKKLLVPVIILLLVKLLFWLSFFSGLEHKAQDALFRLRGTKPVSGEIVIVAIDDVTFQALNRPWPFPREMHAKLVENLDRAGASQIIFDLEFLEDSNPAGDSTLAASCAMVQNVTFCGKHLRDPANPDHVQIQKPIHPILSANKNWGIVNMIMDDDGFIRDYILFEEFGEQRIYSLGMVALANWLEYRPDWENTISLTPGRINVGGHQIPVIRKNKARINYYGGAQTFPHYSYCSVLDDSTMAMPGYQGAEIDEFYDLLESGVFQGKTVLIGATIDELRDKFPTPFSRQLTSGVEIHANFLEMARRGDYLYPVNGWLFLLLELILAVAIYYVLTWFKPHQAVYIALALIAAFLVGSYLLFSRLDTLIPVVEVVILVVLLYVAALVSHYLRTQKEKRFIKNAFQQYMAPELVNQLIKHPETLKYGGVLRELTVLFSDIVSFTTYTEQHQPEETVQILKEYLTEMVKVVIRNGGIVDKFVGDEIIALYSVPLHTEEHALQACKTALDMRACLSRLCEKWKEEGVEPFDFGVGINTGLAVVGNLGSELIFDYTAIGDTINLGARLEALTRNYETAHRIIISESTYAKVQDQVEARYLDDVRVKGKNLSVKIYELLSVKGFTPESGA